MRTWKLQPQFASKKRKVAENFGEKPEVHFWDDMISNVDTLTALSSEAQLLWNTHGGDKSTAKSFWVSKEDTPSCLLEKFALHIGEFHSINNFHDEDAFLGVEFWVQHRQGNYNNKEAKHGLEFHFDKDEKSAEEDDKWYHPTFSTVTYLEAQNTTVPSGGVPLVIFSTPSPEEGEKDVEQEFPRYSWVVNPQPNRHVIFQGNLLHGCPSDLVDSILYRHALDSGLTNDDGEPVIIDKEYSRLSIAVNIWIDKEPKNLKRLDISTLTASTNNKDNKVNQTLLEKNKQINLELDTTHTTSVVKVKVNSKMPIENLFFTKEHREGDTAPLPIEVIKREFVCFMNKGEYGGKSVVAVKYYSD